MSNADGPRINTSNLTLCLDASDMNSYPGVGAVWKDLSGNALDASGNASYITSTGVTAGVSWGTSTTSILNTDTHSIFFMLKLNSSVTYPNGHTGGWEKIFTYNPSGTDRSPGVWRYPSNRLIHWRYDPGNTGVDFGKDISTTEFNLNTWYYIGVTKNGATATAYVNGLYVNSATVANPKTSGTAGVTINEYYTNPLNNVNCVQVYDRVLTPSEIKENFNSIRSRFGI